MRKVFLLMSVALAMVISSCSQDENLDQNPGETGGIGNFEVCIDFSAAETPRASSNAIPITTWSNVNNMQLFLYDNTTGNVAFSYVLGTPTSESGTSKTYVWTNVPAGVYKVAVVANVDSQSENINTSLDGGATLTRFNSYNVVGKAINSGVYMDLKPTTLPSVFTDPLRKGFAPVSEVFTAYSTNTITISASTPNTTLTGVNALKLTREISLMRVRINKKDKAASAPALSTLAFETGDNFITVQNLPTGLGMELGAFAGGIYGSVASNVNRIILGASGVGTTYNTADPTSGYSPSQIIDSGSNPDFSLWQEIKVLPNAARADNKLASDDADASRKFWIIITARAPAGYVYANGQVATANQLVYWSGTVNGVFAPNVIREVNLNITSAGSPFLPDVPVEEGGLTITLDAPAPWNSVIQSEDKEI